MDIEKKPCGTLYDGGRITLKDVADHMTGPALSIIFHVLLVALIGAIIIIRPPERQRELVVDVVTIDVVPIPKILEFERIPDEMQDKPKVPDLDVAPQRMADSKIDFTDPLDVPSSAVEVSISIPWTKSAKIIPTGGHTGALRPGGIAECLDKYNPTTGGITEDAVLRALKWLASKQNSDGSWGDDKGKQPALTALAMLCFLGHGEELSRSAYKDVVRNGLMRLVEFTESSGANGVIQNGGSGYGHAMVAYALSEAWTLTKLDAVERAMTRTVSAIVKGQNRLGSFNYNFNNALAKADPKTGKVDGVEGEPRCDLSVAGWNIQALKAAFTAGCKVDGLAMALERARLAIEDVHRNQDGSFSYGRGGKGAAGDGYSMTPVGTLCLQFLGAENGAAAKRGLKWIESFKGQGEELGMDWRNIPGAWSLYAWYYQTQALFQGHDGKGAPWRKWSNEFSRTLCKEQERDGRWRTPMDKRGGKGVSHGETSREGAADPNTKTPQKPLFTELDADIYATCLCTMMLEVYYRILPSYKQVSVSSHERPDSDDGLRL